MPNLFSGRIGGRLFPRRLSSPQRPLFLVTLAPHPHSPLVCSACGELAGALLAAQAGGPRPVRQGRADARGAERTSRRRAHPQGLQHVIDAYRKVYYVAPASSKADASVVAVAELLAEMGRTFSPGEKDLRAAISRIRVPAPRISRQQVPLRGAVHHRADLQARTWTTMPRRARDLRGFVKHYPHNSLVAQARQELAELNQPKQPAATTAKKQQPVDEAHIQPPPPPNPDQATEPPIPVAQHKPGTALPLVTGIRLLVDARLHPRGHRCGRRGEVRSRTRAQSRPHLLRPAQYQAGVGAGGQELRCAGRIPEEDSRGAISAGIPRAWCWRWPTSPITRPSCCPIPTG